MERHSHARVRRHIAGVDHAGAYLGSYHSLDDLQYLRMGAGLTEEIPLTGKVGETSHPRLDVVLFASLFAFDSPQLFQPGKQSLNLFASQRLLKIR